MLGYGVVWLSVRGRRPFHAPEGWALALLALLTVLALGVTAQVTDRAASGVGGVSQLRRRIYWLSLAVGLLGVYVMQPALRHVGASHGVISVFTASSPLLVAGVVLVAGTAAWLNWYAFGLGVWLIAVAALERVAPGPGRSLGRGRAGGRCPVPGDGRHRPRAGTLMSEGGLDPVIHAPSGCA